MFCKRCGEKLEPNTSSKLCDDCIEEGVTESSLIDSLCRFYRTCFVISFWVNMVGCLVGGYGIYILLDGIYRNTVLVFLITCLVVVASVLLTMLAYGLIAVFLNIEKGIGNLNKKVGDLDVNIRNIGKINVKMANSLNAIGADINKSRI